MMNTRSKIELITLLIVIILIAGCIQQERESLSDDPALICKKIKNSDIKFNCLGIVKSDILTCDRITDRLLKIECYQYIASITGNSLPCESIKSSTLCENMTDSYLKNLCYNNTANHKNRCYIHVAGTTKNLSICKGLPPSIHSECYSYVARKIGNSSLCGEITTLGSFKDEWWKNICYSEVAKMTENSSLCEKITSENERDRCYLDIVEITKKSSVCGYIQDQYVREMCHWYVKGSAGNLSMCEGHANDYLALNCFRYVLKHHKNPSLSLCEGRGLSCYIALVEVTQDPSLYCESKDNAYLTTYTQYGYSKQEAKDLCYQSFIILARLENPSICENIVNEKIKDLCYRDCALRMANIKLDY